MATTIRELAKAVGVSPATVSRALTNPEMVTAGRREQIQKMAIRMGYRSESSRSYRAQKTIKIGIVVPDLENPVFAAIVKGAQKGARRGGYTVFVADSEEEPSLEAEFVAQFSQQVDGMILCSPRMSMELVQKHAAKTPSVLVNREAQDISSVTVDNMSGMRLALTHLYALGHRVVAYLPGPRDSWSGRARLQGLQKTVADLSGLKLTEFPPVPPVFAGGVASADLVRASNATAVICYNDLVALGVLNRLKSRGVSVPAELSIIGFDDIPASTLVSPTLTTLGVPGRQLGQSAVDQLLTLIAEPSTPCFTQELPVDLVVRESTAEPEERSIDSGDGLSLGENIGARTGPEPPASNPATTQMSL